MSDCVVCLMSRGLWENTWVFLINSLLFVDQMNINSVISLAESDVHNGLSTCVCVFTCARACVYACVRTCMRACANVCVRLCVCTWVCVCVFSLVWLCVFACVCAYVHMCVRIVLKKQLYSSIMSSHSQNFLRETGFHGNMMRMMMFYTLAQ